MNDSPFDPQKLLTPRRRIVGMSAVLLPFTDQGGFDWDGFRRHVARTAEAGLTPAVNMDTGFVSLLEDATRATVLRHTREALGGQPFVAGTFVGDRPGDAWDPDAYSRQIEVIHEHGGTPIVFPSYGLTSLPGRRVVDAHAELARRCPRFLAFELGTMFVPFGRIYDLETFAGLLAVSECVGAKHSSLRRDLEWQRLIKRNAVRPDFMVLTGNDLAIDMVMYGSDYLLGLSTFAPDLFGKRDALWAAGDPAFYELNDRLQYLGSLAFRPPVPGYRHNAAQFLRLRGWIKSDVTHPQSPMRPASDLPLLSQIAQSLGVLREEARA